jgi:hypothetical protein
MNATEQLSPADALDDADPTNSRGTSQVEKWGHAVAGAGFTAIPNVLLLAQRKLGITPSELAVLAQLLRCYWYADRPPHPTLEQLEEALPMQRRAIQRALAGLQEKKLIARIAPDPKDGKNARRKFDLAGLHARLDELAVLLAIDKRRRQTQSGTRRAFPREHGTP